MQLARRLLQAMFGTPSGGTPASTHTAPARSANVLIVQGNSATATFGATRLGNEITALGNAVTTVVDVPETLTGYREIYDLRIGNAPASVPTYGEQLRYLDFLTSAPGNALILMGEDSASITPRNQRINDFIALAGGDIAASPSAQHADAHARNFATGGGGSIYFCQGTLANAPHAGLLVVYETGFMTDYSFPISTHTIPFRHNLESRVSAGAATRPSQSVAA